MSTFEASNWCIFDGPIHPDYLLLLSCFGVLRAEGQFDWI